MRRREFVTALAAATAAAAQTQPAVERKGRLKQSVMRVNFDPKMAFDDMCREAARLGAKGFDLAGPNDWPTLKKYGLIPTMVNGPASFKDGLIRPELHEALEKSMGTAIDQAAAAGAPNVITVGGQRRGMAYPEAADNCVAFFNRIKARAEDKGVTVCIEVMNSRLTPDTLGRLDQVCDHVAWGVDVVKRVNSPRVKILFDIYHVQIMDGDIITRIRQHHDLIGHYHTAGNPGRGELDDTQEISYRPIMQEIVKTGYQGYVGQEFIPTRDPLAGLQQACALCDV